MLKKALAVIAAIMLLGMLPAVTVPAKADVYIPSGPSPWYNGQMNAWISPTLFVIDNQDEKPIGWVYSDGDMWVATSSLIPMPVATYDWMLPGQTFVPKIHKSTPQVPWGIDRTDIPFGSQVTVIGYIPGVAVSPDQVPPPIEIVITWNGVPYVVTLTLPVDQVVGWEYPPKAYDDIETVYEFSYPYEKDGVPNAPWKEAYYNIWVGDPNDIDPTEPFDMPFGYYFWYIFYPNVGDWIAWNCVGETKQPPTYDITALFEYKTTQIWFNHVCFDVSLLEVHRTVDWASPLIGQIGMANEITDEFLITNVGKVPATELDIFLTLPIDPKVFLAPDWDTATIAVTGGRIFVAPAPRFVFGREFDLPSDYMGFDLSILYPGETMTFYIEHNLFNPATQTTPPWSGTLVFDAYVSAWEIPPWKYPRAMHSIWIGQGYPIGMEFLWSGWKLLPADGMEGNYEGYVYTFVQEWPILLPKIRMPIPPPGTPAMKLDPVPIDLNGDGVINGQDVALVRQAIVGLIPYKHEMDINVNGKVDTYDLAQYKLAAD